MTARVEMAALEAALAAMPRAYPGPGGAAAVLHRGEVVARHGWGWANAERRIPFTPATLFRLCSITKQFTCAALLDAFSDPGVLDSDVAARLPALTEAPPRTLHLAHNQSGLRDYWAVAMLYGAAAEAPFGDAEAARVIGGTRTLHFAPGTRFSYVNQNFRLLSDILQARAGRSFGEILRARVFDRAGMATAFVAADTRAMPDGTEGYEGTQAAGFRAAENRVIWTGDAALGASLDDMIAWERHVDATREDAEGLYTRLTMKVAYADGRAAEYGFGLSRRRVLGRAATSHGGALRGWRSHRMYLPGERLSVVVMFNHMADAHDAALGLAAAALGEARPVADATLPMPDWLGAYIDPDTLLAARIDQHGEGRVRLRYGQSAEVLDLQADGSAGSLATRLLLTAGGLRMQRPQEHASVLLRPVAGVAAADFAGRYCCAELDAVLTVADAGGVPYGAFSGFLGQGRMELLEPIGPDLWALPCPRALDCAPPGDWTLALRRDERGAVAAIVVGCWLARGLVFQADR